MVSFSSKDLSQVLSQNFLSYLDSNPGTIDEQYVISLLQTNGLSPSSFPNLLDFFISDLNNRIKNNLKV